MKKPMGINWGLILHIVIKLGTGIIIVPLGILLAQLWPKWEEQEGFKKYLYGAFILPLAGILYFPIKWWDGY
jgi:hypothetical protein